jgi:S-(hydroxymethyl)glutathione dehydrogenase / alcohol dehydrogenase
MKTLAAVLIEHNRPLELLDLKIPPLQPGQVLVEIAYSGVCGTQIGEWRGTRGPDKFLPHCLGHEAGGFVREVGGGIWKVKADDTVVLSWLKGSGRNVPGTKYQVYGGDMVSAGAATTFQRYAVVSENRVTPLPAGFDMKAAALLGCPVPTGVGAVLNTAGARPGQSVAVFGCGGVGLCAIAGAKAVGCWPIAAIDVKSDRLQLAKKMGATQLIGVGHELASHYEFDIAIEASGIPEVMSQSLTSVRSQGGVVVILGNAKHGKTLTINPRWLNDGKQLRGSWGGDSVPHRDFPRYIRMIQSGQLNLSPLMGDVFPLESINEAIGKMERGEVVRPLIQMRPSEP